MILDVEISRVKKHRRITSKIVYENLSIRRKKLGSAPLGFTRRQKRIYLDFDGRVLS